jgi:hypothetical protein
MHSGADAIKILQECSSSSHLPPTPLPPRDAEAPAEPDVSVQFSVFSSQCSVIAESSLGRARLPPSRTSPHHSGGRGSRRAETPPQANSPPLGSATPPTQHAQFSASFRVIPRPSFPAETNNHTTRSIFHVIPRHSAAIISRRAETHTSQQLPPARQEPRPPKGGLHLPGRDDRQPQQQHTTHSNFRVIPRNSAAIISRQAEQPHNIRRLGRSLALPRRPPPPRTIRQTTATPTHNTLNFPRHSALFRGHRFLPR